ncbi:Hpt domain-containing protein [Nitrosomonas sp. wSCUT-2]
MSFDPDGRMPVTAVINLDRLNALRQLDPNGNTGFLKRLVNIFLASTPDFVKNIETAIQAGDRAELVRGVHSLRSSAANVGAEKLSEICRLLEESGDHLQSDNIVNLLLRLQNEFRSVTNALQQLQGDL